MAQKKQKYSMKGILRGVEITEGQKKDGSNWKRAALTIEKEDGQQAKVATFNEKDITTANGLNGKEVEVLYSKSPDGKYRNLEQINQIGQGEAPVTDEEPVGEEESPKEEKEEIKEEIIKEEVTPKSTDMTKEEWAEKDKKANRAMAVSYAKDLAIAEIIKLKEIKPTAETMFEYIWNGYAGDK